VLTIAVCAKAGIDAWVPTFDQARVLAAFENHFHTFKRTRPMKDGKLNDKGTVRCCLSRRP